MDEKTPPRTDKGPANVTMHPGYATQIEHHTASDGGNVVERNLFHDAKDATETEHKLTLSGALKLYPKAVGWSVFVSAACVMEGYDTAFLGQLFAEQSFQRQFGVPYNGSYQLTAGWQTALANASSIGIIIGILLNGYISERIGMKKTMLCAYVAITGLTFILVFAQSNSVLFVGQLLCGIPWGIFNTTAPAYASEVCPVILRGYLTTFINLTWIIGQLISAGVLRGVQGMAGKWAYDIPFALQWIWPVPLAVGMVFCPESPWWLLRKGRVEDAERSLERLSVGTETKKTIAMMIRTDQEEGDNEADSYWDCFKGVDLRRTEIAFFAWGIQIWCGLSMQPYNTYFFEQAGLSYSKSFDLSLGYYAIGFVGTVLSWFLITWYGRRSIFLVGLVVMCTIIQSFVIWVFIYDISVGPLAFCIVSEVSATWMRAKTIAIGRFSFYFWYIIFGIVTPYVLNPAQGNWKGKAGFLFGGTCLLSVIWTYFRLPELKGRTYEELDLLFARRIPARKFGSTYVNAYAEEETETKSA